MINSSHPIWCSGSTQMCKQRMRNSLPGHWWHKREWSLMVPNLTVCLDPAPMPLCVGDSWVWSTYDNLVSLVPRDFTISRAPGKEERCFKQCPAFSFGQTSCHIKCAKEVPSPTLHELVCWWVQRSLQGPCCWHTVPILWLASGSEKSEQGATWLHQPSVDTFISYDPRAKFYRMDPEKHLPISMIQLASVMFKGCAYYQASGIYLTYTWWATKIPLPNFPWRGGSHLYNCSMISTTVFHTSIASILDHVCSLGYKYWDQHSMQMNEKPVLCLLILLDPSCRNLLNVQSLYTNLPVMWWPPFS